MTIKIEADGRKMTDYTKFQPKLTRAEAYAFYKEWSAADRKLNIADKAKQFGVCPAALRTKLRAIDRCVRLDTEKKFGRNNHLENYLAYRWKNGCVWSISIWSPDYPGKRQLSLPNVMGTCRPLEARK